MAEILLEVQPREVKGKSVKKLRRVGVIPAVIYGGGKEGVSIQISEKDFLKALKGHTIENLLVTLHVSNDKSKKGTMALIRDVQVDPIKDSVVHVDFQEVSMEKKLRTKVHIEAFGDPVGVAQEGGILECTLREVEIECLPMNIPEVLKVDVSQLHVNNSLFVRDLLPPEGVEILTLKDISMFSVSLPKMEEEVPKEGEVTEPEVIGKKKEEGAVEGEAAPASVKGEKKEPEAKETKEKKEK